MLRKYKWENSILERQRGFSYSPSLEGYCASQVVDVIPPSASELINLPELCCNYLKVHHLEFLLVSQHFHAQAPWPQLPEHPGRPVQGGLWVLGEQRAARLPCPTAQQRVTLTPQVARVTPPASPDRGSETICS